MLVCPELTCATTQTVCRRSNCGRRTMSRPSAKRACRVRTQWQSFFRKIPQFIRGLGLICALFIARGRYGRGWDCLPDASADAGTQVFFNMCNIVFTKRGLITISSERVCECVAAHVFAEYETHPEVHEKRPSAIVSSTDFFGK